MALRAATAEMHRLRGILGHHRLAGVAQANVLAETLQITPRGELVRLHGQRARARLEAVRTRRPLLVDVLGPAAIGPTTIRHFGTLRILGMRLAPEDAQ